MGTITVKYKGNVVDAIVTITATSGTVDVAWRTQFSWQTGRAHVQFHKVLWNALSRAQFLSGNYALEVTLTDDDAELIDQDGYVHPLPTIMQMENPLTPTINQIETPTPQETLTEIPLTPTTETTETETETETSTSLIAIPVFVVLILLLFLIFGASKK